MSKKLSDTIPQFIEFDGQRYGVHKFDHGRDQSYCLKNGAQRLVLRRLPPQHFWRFDYQRQTQFLQAVESQGWAAKLLSHSNNYQIWEFIEGRTVKFSDWNKDCVFNQLCKFLLSKPELSNGTSVDLHLAEYINKLMVAAKTQNRLTQESDAGFYQHCHEIQTQISKFSRVGLNHHDLHTDNFLLQRSGQLKVIDWEYFGTSCYGWDWVYGCLHLPLNQLQQQTLKDLSGLSVEQWQLLEMTIGCVDKLWSLASANDERGYSPTSSIAR